MLGWAIAFLIIALVSALLGFGSTIPEVAGTFKVLFVVFFVAFMLVLLF